MSEKKYRRSILNVLKSNVPGARENVILILTVLSVFFFAVIASSYVFVKIVQVGYYAERVLMSNMYIILCFWGVMWLVAFFYSIRNMLLISYRVAGPIRRIEGLLDEILNGKDVQIKLRENDALVGITTRINQLLEMQKNGKLEAQRKKYETIIKNQ